jgi:hypothetical protein
MVEFGRKNAFIIANFGAICNILDCLIISGTMKNHTDLMQTTRKWYRGDFHIHSTASGARYTPMELVDMAIKEGCDFIALTDHNTISAVEEIRNQDRLLILPGMEISLDEGHWNVFGVDQRQDWMKYICTGQITTTLVGKSCSVNQLLKSLAQKGYFNSLNHPFLEPWQWTVGSVEMEYIHGIEIWNDPYWADNDLATPKAIEFWTRLLNEGYRITALGGSDFHLLPGDQSGYPGEKPSLPATYVLAEELSFLGIMDGIRQCRVYLTSGANCSMTGMVNGRIYEIGEDVGLIRGDFEIHLRVADCEQATEVRLIKNGENLKTWSINSTGLQDCFIDHLIKEAVWYRLEVWNQLGGLLAITNPIFCGSQPHSQKKRFQDFL